MRRGIIMEGIHWPTIFFILLLTLIIFLISYSRNVAKRNVKFLNEDEFALGMRKGRHAKRATN